MTRPAWLNPAFQGLDCGSCGFRVEAEAMEPVCPRCWKPLVARYDLERIAKTWPREELDRGEPGLWRYRFLLPFAPGFRPVGLGEGGTPLLALRRLAREYSVSELWLKDEAENPTQSFKARGLAVAVSAALAMGKGAIALPSAGNAGSAAAAYAAAAGLRCRIAIPEDTPEAFLVEQRALGAEILRVPGTIADAGRALQEWAPAPDWWNVATFREPFRLEGKKTLGYEIAEQSGWRPPELIFYPTGGGTGLVGMWRAFAELAEMGWLEGTRPRFVAVQSEGCAPVVGAWEAGRDRVTPWESARTLASGLQVPAPFADELVLRAIRESGGQAVAVGEEEILDAMGTLAEKEGCFACPEGGATLAAFLRLRARGTISPDDRVVLFNTGSGLKYLEAWKHVLARRRRGSGVNA